MNNKLSIKILTQDDLIKAGCFDMKSAINITEKTFIQYAQNKIIFPEKVSVIFKEDEQNRINCLPAGILPSNIYGMKWVSVFPNNPHKRNIPNLSAVIILSDLETGFPKVFMEGSLCSNIRTASVGAIAAKFLAKENSESIGFIGAGEQAKSHLLAIKEVIPTLKKCKVSSRTIESELTFIKQMKSFFPDIDFEACNSNYERAAKNSDIIITAISGQEKILKAEWITEGAFYCHVAGLEDDFDVALKADKIIVDNWEVVKHRTQTISQMYKLGILKDDDIYANIDQIIMGEKKARENNNEFIYFNSVGMSFLDVALANWMYDKCVSSNIGQDINLKSNSMFDIYLQKCLKYDK